MHSLEIKLLPLLYVFRSRIITVITVHIHVLVHVHVPTFSTRQWVLRRVSYFGRPMV